MPRKKNIEPEVATTEALVPVVPEEKPKRRPRAKKTEVQPTEDTSTKVTAESTPTPTVRRRRKPAASEAVPSGPPDEAPTVETPAAFEEPDKPVAPKKSRSRKPKEPLAEEAAAAEPAKPKRRKSASSAPSGDLATMLGWDPESTLFPTIEWRPATPRPARRSKPAPVPATSPAVPAVKEPPQKRTRRKQSEPKTAQPAEAEAPAPTPPPAPTRRPAIVPPDHAPCVVFRNGSPAIVRNQKVYPPLFFFGSSPDERRLANVLEEMRMATDAGIHLHAHLVELEVDRQSIDHAATVAAYLLRKSLEVDPEAQVLFRILFVAPSNWSSRYPKSKQRSGSALAEPSICDDDYWNEAEVCLRAWIAKLRKLEESASIIGVHLDRGEWFLPASSGYDTTDAAAHKFRDWARVRYAGDVVALQASWFDGKATFDSIAPPEFKPSPNGARKLVRSSRKERKWVDYHLFLSDATVERIGQLAYAVKDESGGELLVGASYGYTFEFAHPWSGHLSLGKLMRTPEIDIIAGPPSYRDREPGGAASFPVPIDSIALNGKLFISEEDFKTSIGEGREPDDFNPVIRTPQALESVHWRGAGAALAHGAGIAWMDLWGNGWLKTRSVWERGKNLLDLIARATAMPLEDPDVAMFVDERSLGYLADDEAFQLLIANARDSALKSGLSTGFYLLSDLIHRERFPESKVYLFLNAWDIRADLRLMIKSRLQNEGKVLFWLYATGLFDGGRESLERVREVTGIALKPQPFHSNSGTTLFHRRHPLSEAMPATGILEASNLEPSYFAIPEDGHVLGEYTQSGLPSFVVRKVVSESASGTWTSVFLGEPYVSPALIRALGSMAGAHIWSYQEDIVHVRAPFVTVHCREAGLRAITLPNKYSAYNVTETRWENTETSTLRFHAAEGSTHVFLVGVREEIEAILTLPLDDLLQMDQVPRRTENTIELDKINFEIPIMRLDEWIETGETDANEDFLLFHAGLDMSDLEPEPPRNEETSGSSRGRRKSRSRSTPKERRSSAVPATSEISFVFRKRED